MVNYGSCLELLQDDWMILGLEFSRSEMCEVMKAPREDPWSSPSMLTSQPVPHLDREMCFHVCFDLFQKKFQYVLIISKNDIIHNNNFS